MTRTETTLRSTWRKYFWAIIKTFCIKIKQTETKWLSKWLAKTIEWESDRRHRLCKFEDVKTTCQSYTIIQNVVSRSAWTIWSYPTNVSTQSLNVSKTSVQRRHFPECDSRSTLWAACPCVCCHSHLNSTRFYTISCSHVREEIEHVRPRSVTSSSIVRQRRITTTTRFYNSRVQDQSSNRECLRWERCLR